MIDKLSEFYSRHIEIKENAVIKPYTSTDHVKYVLNYFYNKMFTHYKSLHILLLNGQFNDCQILGRTMHEGIAVLDNILINPEENAIKWKNEVFKYDKQDAEYGNFDIEKMKKLHREVAKQYKLTIDYDNKHGLPKTKKNLVKNTYKTDEAYDVYSRWVHWNVGGAKCSTDIKDIENKMILKYFESEKNAIGSFIDGFHAIHIMLDVLTSEGLIEIEKNVFEKIMKDFKALITN